MRKENFRARFFAKLLPTVGFVFFSFWFFSPAAAADGIGVRLRIEGPETTILDADVVLPEECQVFDAVTTTPHVFSGDRAVCVLEQAKTENLIQSYQVTDWGFGFSLDSVNGIANAADWSQTWIIRINNQAALAGIDGLELQKDDELFLAYGPWPMEPLLISPLATSTFAAGEPINFSVQAWDDNTQQFESFNSSTTYWLNGESYFSASGTLEWTPSQPGEYQVWVEVQGKTRSSPVSFTAFFPAPETTPVNLKIRHQNQFVFDATINLSSSTAFSYTDTADNSTQSTSTGQNVLAAMLAADAASTDFSASEILYYPAFDSFYLNCLALTAPTDTTVCANWNYVVDGVYPSVGMDSYSLAGGETVYIYFGNSWSITASTSTFPVNTTTTFSSWRYNYDDLANEWTPDADDLIDISVPNPNSSGWWDATITTTTLTTNASGTIDYVFSATGTFYAKIASADFSKWSLPIALTVTEALSSATGTPDGNGGNGGGGAGNGGGTGGGGQPTVSTAVIAEKTQAILNFLKSWQDADGKIIDGGVSDWAMMSFGADNQYANDVKKNAVSLLDFAKGYSFTDASDLNLCAGYPRHVLALLSAGVSGADGAIPPLIDKIKSAECFKDNQYGQNGINDDVFALFALLAADNPVAEPIVTDILAAIINDQTEKGAFTWAGFAGPDITGAAVNVLKYAQNKGLAVDQTVLDNAKNYLKKEQLPDGGWGFGSSDALTTSWAMMGINSLGEGQIEWSSSQNKNPWSVLVEQLKSGGYYESSWSPGTIDWFGVKHAAPALLGKSWPIVLEPKPPPASPANNGGGAVGSVLGLSDNNTATSTVFSDIPLFPATSTLPIVQTTSTLPAASSTAVLETAPAAINDLTASSAVSVAIPIANTALPSFTRFGKIKEVSSAPAASEDILPATASSLPASIEATDSLLPLEKKIATTTAAGSAVLFAGATLFLFARLLLAVL